MFHNDQSLRKRQKFRIQIRKRQIQHLFSERRKLFIIENANSNQQNQNINSIDILISRSLVKNQLLSQIDGILASLKYKIKCNPCIENIEFVVLLCANLLQDDVAIEHKQQIYELCVHTIGISKLQTTFVLFQVNIYDVIFGTCYDYLDEQSKIQIQTKLLPRTISILVSQQIDRSRMSETYSYEQCMQQKYQGCLSALLHFYCSEIDHNLVLHYKVKRTLHEIKTIIHWFIDQQAKLTHYKNYIEIVETFNAIFGNITQIPQQFHTLVDQRTFYSLVSLFINQITMQDQKLVFSKTTAMRVLTNLLMNQPNLLITVTQNDITKTLLYQLQNSIDNRYTKQLILFFKNCIVGIKEQKIVNDDHICCLISLIKQAMAKQMLQDNNELIMPCLELVRTILIRGYDLANSQYRNMLSSTGLIEKLQDLYISQKNNKQIVELIDQIYYYTDLC